MPAATKRKAGARKRPAQTDLSFSAGLRNATVRLGRTLRATRLERELSQADLGLDAGLDQSTIAQLEAGTYPPSFESLLRLAHSLKSTPAVLLTGVKL